MFSTQVSQKFKTGQCVRIISARDCQGRRIAFNRDFTVSVPEEMLEAAQISPFFGKLPFSL